MIILGVAESKDRKGAELESLTRRLLEAMGYTNIVTNKIDSGGSEIDVSADHVVQSLGGNTRHRIICECKAYKKPIDTNDWLKFLGKCFQEQSLLPGETVIGCLIALSGANGPVNGSYDKLPQRGEKIRLLSGDSLAEIVRRIFGITAWKDVLPRLQQVTDRVYGSADIMYFGGSVYWVVVFDRQYTILDASGAVIPRVVVEPLLGHVQEEMAVDSYVDLQEEAKAKELANRAEKAVVGSIMEGNGEITIDKVHGWYADIETEELRNAARVLSVRGWVVTEDDICRFAPTAISNVQQLADIYRFLIDRLAFIRVLGCAWYDAHINTELISEVCRIQGNLPLSTEDVETAVTLMRWSPGALLYSLMPDPMLVAHPRDRAKEPEFDLTDQQHFLRTLYRHLVLNFEQGKMNQYFYEVRGIVEIDRDQRIVVKSAATVIHRGSVRQRQMIGRAAPDLGGGHVLILRPNDGPEPWELFNARPMPPAEAPV